LQYAQSIGANAAQIFLGSNRSASLKTKTHLTPTDIQEIKMFLAASKMILIVHTIYLLNLCKAQPHSGMVKWQHVNILYDMKMAARLGAKCVVVHLGSRIKEIGNTRVDMPIQEALDNLIANINYILSRAPYGIQLSLETAAGAGSQVGYTLDELAKIWKGVRHHGAKRVGICIDTAHIFVAGEDISTPAGIRDYLKRFDNLIGIQHITNFHINDSRYPRGSRHDEHRGLGAGQIFHSPQGQAALATLTRFARKHRIPMILETHGSARPHSEGTSKGAHGYEWEIAHVNNII
jgi:deoxyribonuclease-4